MNTYPRPAKLLIQCGILNITEAMLPYKIGFIATACKISGLIFFNIKINFIKTFASDIGLISPLLILILITLIPWASIIFDLEPVFLLPNRHQIPLMDSIAMGSL